MQEHVVDDDEGTIATATTTETNANDAPKDVAPCTSRDALANRSTDAAGVRRRILPANSSKTMTDLADSNDNSEEADPGEIDEKPTPEELGWWFI